eukprot:scaffold64827_cov41-Attheya_sp.AAC.2
MLFGGGGGGGDGAWLEMTNGLDQVGSNVICPFQLQQLKVSDQIIQMTEELQLQFGKRQRRRRHSFRGGGRRRRYF